MSYQTDILEAAQDYGLVLGKTLKEYAGWRTRGSEIFSPRGSVNHHTAGPRTGDLPTLYTLLYGRSDLPGPLCNAALSRSAVIHLIAAGRANHAGSGGWAGLSGNSSVWGLEVEHYGYPDEAVSEARWDSMYRWHRACMDVSGFSSSAVCQHFEWAPDRKIDFCKPLIPNPGLFRSRVASITQGDNDMDAAQDLRLKAVELDVKKLLQLLQPRATQTVITTGDNIGKVDPAGEPGVGDIWRWAVYLELERQGRKDDLVKNIAKAVVAALPPTSGGGGVTQLEVQADAEAAIKKVLGGLG